jgi:hypothetical protein
MWEETAVAYLRHHHGIFLETDKNTRNFDNDNRSLGGDLNPEPLITK